MTSFGRIGPLILGLALALAWSSTASARPKEKKKRATPSASVSHSSRSGGFHAPSKPQPSRATAPAPRATHTSSGGRSAAPTGTYRPSTPSRSVEPGTAGGHSRSGSLAATPRATPRPSATVRSPATPSKRGRDFRTPEEPGALQRLTHQVPPTVSRGGRTFTQHVVAQGEAVVVRRAAPDIQPLPPKTAQSHSQAHHHGDHDHYYHHHHWGNAHYYCYVHYWVYAPWFWGFYFAPFPTPWYYTWVWYGAPWYVAWGWYYSPYPYYAAPSYWVTDYVVASMLEDEYVRGYTAGYADGRQAEGTPISEPVKEQLRQQVDETAQAFQTEKAIALETALQNPEYLFVVDTSISVATAGNNTCGLSGGDIIRPAGAVDPAVPVASMAVVTSKNESCAAGSVVNVSFTDLQEMLNTFGERVDDGLNELQNQGQAQQEGAGR